MAKLSGEGGEGMVAKSLKSLGEGRGEGGEGIAAKSLICIGRRLAKVAKHRDPLLRRGLEAPVSEVGHIEADQHHIDCEWHLDQYAFECTCGATGPKATWFDRCAADGERLRAEQRLREEIEGGVDADL